MNARSLKKTDALSVDGGISMVKWRHIDEYFWGVGEDEQNILS
jgi:hypothetical protein